jgi:hypothetical protein
MSEAYISKVVQVAKIYEQDLPSPFSLKGEIALLQTYWSGKKKDVTLPSTAAEAYHEASVFSEYENFTSDFNHHSCHYVFSEKKLFDVEIVEKLSQIYDGNRTIKWISINVYK